MLLIFQRYLIKQYLFYLALIILGISGMLFIFDFIELTRIAISKNISFDKIILLAAQKNPVHLQKVFGFIILLATMLTYRSLARTSELVIFKSAGLSTYQYVMPVAVLGMILGLLYTTVINPLTTVATARYMKNEALYIKGLPSLLSVSKTGLWIKQENGDGEQSLIHALKVEQKHKQLHDVTFYFLSKDSGFNKRIDASLVEFQDGRWLIASGTETAENKIREPIQDIEIPTNISFEQIQESLGVPEGFSFWKLPAFISLAENSGLAVNKYKVYFYRLLMNPLFFAAMIIMGAAFSMTHARFERSHIMVITLLIMGFVIYFISDLTFAFTGSGRAPMWLGVCAPSLLAFLIGIIVIIQLEETRIK